MFIKKKVNYNIDGKKYVANEGYRKYILEEFAVAGNCNNKDTIQLE